MPDARERTIERGIINDTYETAITRALLNPGVLIDP